jgi:GNAT superfamily N-acetyltransferase
MSGGPPAGVVHYRVHHLAMEARPSWGHPQLPVGREAALLVAESPPAWYFLALHDAVGRDYAWDLPEGGDPRAIETWLADPAVTLATLLRGGWPHGFYVLDARAGASVRLAQFGIVPEARGRGYGSYLVRTAVLAAWSLPATRRVEVSTTSLDHPRALALYQRHGFVIVAQEARSRVLPARGAAAPQE